MSDVKVVVDCSSGRVKARPLNEEELAQRELDTATGLERAWAELRA